MSGGQQNLGSGIRERLADRHLLSQRDQTILIQMATTVAPTAPSASPEALPMELARALGDPLRWRIVELLSTEQLCVAHLAEELASLLPEVEAAEASQTEVSEGAAERIREIRQRHKGKSSLVKRFEKKSLGK